MMADERREWHLDKTLNLGHILATVSLTAGMLGYVTTMDKRLAILEAQTQTNMVVITQLQASQKDLSKDIRDEIRGLRAELLDLVRNEQKRR